MGWSPDRHIHPTSGYGVVSRPPHPPDRRSPAMDNPTVEEKRRPSVVAAAGSGDPATTGPATTGSGDPATNGDPATTRGHGLGSPYYFLGGSFRLRGTAAAHPAGKRAGGLGGGQRDVAIDQQLERTIYPKVESFKGCRLEERIFGQLYIFTRLFVALATGVVQVHLLRPYQRASATATGYASPNGSQS